MEDVEETEEIEEIEETITEIKLKKAEETENYTLQLRPLQRLIKQFSSDDDEGNREKEVEKNSNNVNDDKNENVSSRNSIGSFEFPLFCVFPLIAVCFISA